MPNGWKLYKESTLMDTLGDPKVSIRYRDPLRSRPKGE